MLFYVNEKGEQTFEKNVFSFERPDIVNNPLFETIYKYPQKDQIERGNLLIGYNTHMNNKYDLDVLS
jgi:hypothetical protein